MSTTAHAWQMIDRATGEVVVPRLRVAATFWSRFRGLQLRAELAADEGLLLAPCNSIHTCFMRFAIDVAWLDGGGTVLGVANGIRPWRVAAGPRETVFALETTAGVLRARPGDLLALPAGSLQVPPDILRPLLAPPSPDSSSPRENGQSEF